MVLHTNRASSNEQMLSTLRDTSLTLAHGNSLRRLRRRIRRHAGSSGGAFVYRSTIRGVRQCGVNCKLTMLASRFACVPCCSYGRSFGRSRACQSERAVRRCGTFVIILEVAVTVTLDLDFGRCRHLSSCVRTSGNAVRNWRWWFDPDSHSLSSINTISLDNNIFYTILSSTAP